MKHRRHQLWFPVVALLALLAVGCGRESSAPLPTVAPPTVVALATAPTAVPPTATAAPSPSSTTLPSDSGDLIAFYSERDGNAEIYTIHADGSAETRLTQNHALDTAPDISPDGSQIVFVSDRDGNEEIYRMNSDGSDVVRLTAAPAKDSYPFWSADGTQIIFCSQRDDGRTYEVYLMNSDGSDPTRITNNSVSEEWAYLSPDMQKIVYAVGPFPDYSLYVMNVDGSEPHQVFSSDRTAAFPKWSRDGSMIAFNYAAFSSGQLTGDIGLVDQDGGDFRQMTTTGGNFVSENAYWSPDGSRIVFQSNRTGNFQLYVMNADGSDIVRLTNHRGNDYYPSWGPAATPAAAASTWFKTYGGRQDDVGWGILPAGDGGYYIVGTTGLAFEPQMRGNVYLIRTDAAGEVLWEKVYERDGYAEGSSIAWAGDGNLLISGPATLPTTDGTDIYLLEVDPAGNELWFRTFGGPLDQMGTAWPLEDGGFLLAGNSIDPNDIVADPGAAGYGGMAGRSNVYLARFDADGTELWSRTYGGENNVMAFDGLRTPDGGLLLLATIMYYPENDDDIYLLKVDADGNEVWSRTWEEGMASAVALDLAGDGNYLLAGSYSPPEVMDREKRDLLFIKVDPQGNEIWRKVWGDPEVGDDASLLAATADGGCIAAGDTGGDLSSWNQDIALLKLDAQGQQLWRRVIATQSHQMYGQLMQHPDGGYLLVGSLVRNGQFDVLLIKTDAQGHVEQP